MVEAFINLEGLADLAGYINNLFICLDLLDQPRKLEKLWGRLLKSYAIEALNSLVCPSSEPRPIPTAITVASDKSEYLKYPSVGLGSDIRLNGPSIIGAGLIVDEQLIHLSVFPKRPQENSSHNIRRPGYKRHNII